MYIKRYTKSVSVVSIKKVIIRNGGVSMVLCLEKYKNRIDDNPAINLSLADMLFDREKRNATYKHYDKKYVSTKEEDEIYNDMTKRYYKEIE